MWGLEFGLRGAPIVRIECRDITFAQLPTFKNDKGIPALLLIVDILIIMIISVSHLF